MSDTLHGVGLLDDTGFRQPPESAPLEPIGDVCVDEDLPELEDAASSSGAEVVGKNSKKGKHQLQKEESVEELKKSEDEFKNSEKVLMESREETKEKQLESEKETKREQLESGEDKKRVQLEIEKETKREQLESGEETKEEQLESEKETKREQLESGEDKKREQLESGEDKKEEPLESGEDKKEEQLEIEEEAKEEQLENGEDKKEEQLENGEAKEEQLENGEDKKEEQLESGEAKEEQLVSKEQRRELFLEAKVLEEAGELDKALEKLTAALTGVRPETAFPELPACLRALAEIYYKREEYEKAVHFVQAEKMYYEAALLDTSVLQRILNKDVKRSLMEDKDDTHLQKLRADEYETLARFCVDKTEFQLALEYAAKAAKLREVAFGLDHEETIRSLDFMTSIYADLGKQEYAESLEKFERSKESPTAKSPAGPPAAAANAPALGQPQEGENFDREVRISLFFFAIMVFIAFAVLTCVSAYAYCKLTVSPLCESATATLSEQLSWLHYHLHMWLL